MPNSELQTVVDAPLEIVGGVGAGMQVGGAAQELAEIAHGGHGNVVDENQSEFTAAVDGAQEAEQRRDV